MSSVGFRGVGWLIVLCGVSCAAAPVAPVRELAKEAPARVDETTPEQPPLTPPPPAKVAAQTKLDLARLVAGLSAGTSARLDLNVMSELWQLPGMELDRPIVMGTSANGSNSIFLTSVKPGATLQYGPEDAELSARGLKPLIGGYCAVRESGAGAPALACGPKPLLLSSTDDLLSRGRELREGHLVELEVSLAPGPSSAVHDWRASAMREVEALLPAGSELAKPPALRLGLLDLAFELVDRVVDSYKRLGPLNVALSSGRSDGFGVSASIESAADSALARAAGTAKNVRIPEAFWELAAHTNQALFFDASLVAPLLEPSARTRALLAEPSAAGSLSQPLLAVPAACASPGRAWALARANQLAPEAKPAVAATPPLPTLGDPRALEAPKPPSYTLLGIEDPQGACGKALRAVLAAHERLAQVPGQAADKRHLSALLVDEALPQTLKLFRLGVGDDATHFALAERKGVLWIGASSDLDALEAALSDLLAPAPRRRGLRSRPELAELGKSAALVSGFLREDDLPFSALSPSKRRFLERANAPDNPELRRIAFAITREQASLRVRGRLEARSLRQVLAKAIADNLDSVELKKLPADKLAPALAMLESACQLGNGDACNVLGLTYGDGRGVAKDAARALRWLELGCEQNSGKACANIAFYKTLNRTEELQLLQKSCELDAAFGCAWWGVKLLASDKPSDHQQGFDKLASACNHFVGFACARLGNHYREGVGLPKDEDKGADFHERACELGLGVGCVGVATAFATGKGRRQDSASAFKRLQRACELDKKEGCYALGMAHLYGQLTTKDEAAARHELGVACDANQADACRVLAELSGEP